MFQSSVQREEKLYLEEGHWFVSLYNDDGASHGVELLTRSREEVSCECREDCNGRGECVAGECDCQPGYEGQSCLLSVCPLLCSGQGEYSGGECVCKPGWKGKECNIRYEECEVPDCSGHGHCEDGKCVCMKVRI